MKLFRLTLLTLLVCISTPIFSQWTTNIVNNQSDLPYKVATCPDECNVAYLKLERIIECNQGVCDTLVVLYLTGGLHCEEEPTVDITFVIAGQNKNYSLTGAKSKDSRTVYICDDLFSDADFVNDFKASTKMIVKINEDYCTDVQYTFTMTGSSRVISFMSKP